MSNPNNKQDPGLGISKHPICDYLLANLSELRQIEKGGKRDVLMFEALRDATQQILTFCCLICGKDRDVRPGRFCSDLCEEAWAGKKIRCEGCSAFVPRTSQEWPYFCGVECRAQAENEADLARTLQEDPVPAMEIRMKDRKDWSKP